MKKTKFQGDPNFYLRKTKKISKNSQNNNMGNNTLNEYDFESFQNMQQMSLNSPMEDAYIGSGEVDDQIQSYKEQLIDAKLKNIKLTNEVKKLKELSKTQTQFYGGLNQDEMDPQNQTDSMFYKSNNMDLKLHIEKLEKKNNKYHEKIKALKEHNSKLEDLVLKLKDTLDRANEVFPNFLMQLSNNNNNINMNNNVENNNSNNINKEKKENPLMVSVGEDPINTYPLNDSNNNINNNTTKIMEENRQLGAENLELKNALAQLEEELEIMKSDKNLLGNDFDNKLKLIQNEMENTTKKNEKLLQEKMQEFNENLLEKQNEIEVYKNEINKLKKENQKYLMQVNTLTEEAQQRIEEIGVLEEQIKNNEYLLKDQNGKDNIIQELNSQIEQYKIENDEIKNEYNDKIEQYNNKITTVFLSLSLNISF